MEKGTIILICGLPGAGKTTLAKKLEVERNAVRLCADEWIIGIIENKSDIPELDRLRDPVEQLLWRLAQVLVQKGVTVILENGFWSSSERKKYVDITKGLGAKIELHYLKASNQTIKERLLKRNENLPDGDFEIDMKKLDEWVKVFEPPSEEEMKLFDYSKTYDQQ